MHTGTMRTAPPGTAKMGAAHPEEENRVKASIARSMLLLAFMLLASACGNNRDYSRGEMKPYIADRATAPVEGVSARHARTR